MPVKRRRKNRSPYENNEQAQENVPTGNLENRKSHSHKYNLTVNGVLTQVCRGVFLKVFQISDNRVKKINKCSVLHRSLLDLRGKSRSGNALPGRNVTKKNKQRFKVSKYKQFLYNNYTPGKLVASEYIEGISTSTFTLLKTVNAPELPAEKAYPLGKDIPQKF
ncbi:hypothetical protein WA026_007485 [Henosepilachna vigintioctopunctata]|uniref:Uncharacterized protein n=1 Tax=Henosepilachna vigintioctopunctata TaxID=420089 RepID=A0AAW1UPA8_9CUCU